MMRNGRTCATNVRTSARAQRSGYECVSRSAVQSQLSLVVTGGWRLGLVTGDWWLVAGGWWLVSELKQLRSRARARRGLVPEPADRRHSPPTVRTYGDRRPAEASATPVVH